MIYPILLFDIDDTLLDFDSNEESSLKQLFKSRGIKDFDTTSKVYRKVNNELWYKYEHGEIDINNLFNTRFAIAMAKLGITADGEEWEAEYRKYLYLGAEPVENSPEIIKRLHDMGYRVFAASNGIKEMQISRLKIAGMYDCFEDIFVSDEVGVQKPLVGFFDYVVSHIKNCNIKETLMIGNSLSSDILGGNRAGIDTCWYNPHKAEQSEEIGSTYVIEKLEDIFKIV